MQDNPEPSIISPNLLFYRYKKSDNVYFHSIPLLHFFNIFVIAVILDTDIAILGFQNLSSGRTGASIFTLWGPFCQLGDTWGTMGAAGRTRGGPKQDF